MSEQSYFQKALSNFTHEAASSGAIRHLTDLGYTVKQISERLDFPTPFERVRRQVWERLLDTGVILTKEPGSGSEEKAEYVREYDRFGKASFRKVVKTSPEITVSHFKELQVDCKDKEKLRSFLEKKISENEEGRANTEGRVYAACDFGMLLRQEPQRFEELLLALDSYQREYIEGLPWEAEICYHRLDSRMLNILLKLSAKGLWQGDCYFLKTGERIHWRS